MVGRFRGVPFSFGALREIYGPLFVRCELCRRYARLYLAELRDTVEGQHHPAAIARLTGKAISAYRLSAKHYGVKAPTR